MNHPLANARTAAGLSQQALAEKVECDRVSIARIESRKQKPSLRLIERIIATLAKKNVELSADVFLAPPPAKRTRASKPRSKAEAAA